VRSRGDVAKVARRFYGDPIVDNDPHTHDGVLSPDDRSSPSASPGG